MVDKTEPKLPVIWWVFFILLILLIALSSIGLFKTAHTVLFASKDSMNWPTVNGRVDWDVFQDVKLRTSKGSQNTVSLVCSYQYEVNDIDYTGTQFQFDDFYRAFDAETRMRIFKCLTKERDNTKPDPVKEIAAEIGKRDYEHKDGFVLVYYNPADPSIAVLKPGKSSAAIGKLIFFPVFLFICFLFLMIQPLKVYLYKKRQKQSTLTSASGNNLNRRRKRQDGTRLKRPLPQEQLITNCPYCEEEFEVSPELLGQVVECPHCQEHLTLPTG